MIDDGGFGAYIHWPFCRAKCPYCDFNSHVRDSIDHKRWCQAILTELNWFADRVNPRPLSSIFFGGGTPSLMAPETVSAVIEQLRARFGLTSDVEITLEANPTSAEAAAFRNFRSAGVNRLSVGMQSFDDAWLKFLGRQHSAREAIAAIEQARQVFPRLSFDLIYALPGQSPEEWAKDLRQAVALAADHLSLYQLTIEDNTGFAGQVARGVFTPMPDDDQAILFELTQDIMTAAGLPAYEISNHAAPGAECRHNLVYWRYGSYLGIGPGAHGRLVIGGKRQASAQLRKPETWLQSVENDGSGGESAEILSETAQIEEYLMMGLRLTEGLSLSRLSHMTGAASEEIFSKEKLRRLLDAGFLAQGEGRLMATAAGRRVLNTLLGKVIEALA